MIRQYVIQNIKSYYFTMIPTYVIISDMSIYHLNFKLQTLCDDIFYGIMYNAIML